jgi:hypothetical protein
VKLYWKGTQIRGVQLAGYLTLTLLSEGVSSAAGRLTKHIKDGDLRAEGDVFDVLMPLRLRDALLFAGNDDEAADLIYGYLEGVE